MIRLNKIISQAGLASRRLADELIAQGRVIVNGKVVSELGAKADPSRDHIKVDGRRLKIEEHKRYFLLFKPKGVVSTRADDKNRATVIDLLSKQGIRGYYYPVGRLDYDSEGLLLLTNDGEFAEIVTHPRHELTRTYEARLLGVPGDHELERLRKGLIVPGGPGGEGERTLPATVKVKRVLKGNRGPEALVEIVIREGRNRQVRNMCDAIGHPVVQLTRTKIGPLTAEGLRPGHVRELRPDEIKMLTKRAASTPKTGSDATPRPKSAALKRQTRPARSREK